MALGCCSIYIRVKNIGRGLVHDPLSAIKKFQTLSLQDVYCSPLPKYYRDAVYIRKV